MGLFNNKKDNDSQIEQVDLNDPEIIPFEFTEVKKGGVDPSEVEVAIKAILDKHADDLEILSQNMREAQSDNEKLKTELSTLKDQAEEEKNFLEAKLAEIQKNPNAASDDKQTQELQNQIIELETRLYSAEQASGTNQEIEEKLEAYEAEIKQLKDRLESSGDSDHQLEKTLHERIEILQNDLESAHKEIDRLKDFEDKTASLELQIKELQDGSTGSELGTRFVEVSTQLNQVKKENRELEAEIARHQAKALNYQEIEDKKEQLEQLIVEQQATIENLEGQLAKAQEKDPEAQNMEQILTMLQETRDELEETQNEYELANRELISLQKDQTQYKNQLEQLETLNGIEKQRADKVQEQLEELRSEYSQAIKDRASAQARVEILERDLEKIREEKPDVGITAQRMMQALAQAREEQEAEIAQSRQQALDEIEDLRNQAKEQAEKMKLELLQQVEGEVSSQRAQIQDQRKKSEDLMAQAQQELLKLTQEADNRVLSARENEEQIRSVVKQTYEMELNRLEDAKQSLQNEVEHLEQRRSYLEVELGKYSDNIQQALDGKDFSAKLDHSENFASTQSQTEPTVNSAPYIDFPTQEAEPTILVEPNTHMNYQATEEPAEQLNQNFTEVQAPRPELPVQPQFTEIQEDQIQEEYDEQPVVDNFQISQLAKVEAPSGNREVKTPSEQAQDYQTVDNQDSQFSQLDHSTNQQNFTNDIPIAKEQPAQVFQVPPLSEEELSNMENQYNQDSPTVQNIFTPPPVQTNPLNNENPVEQQEDIQDEGLPFQPSTPPTTSVTQKHFSSSPQAEASFNNPLNSEANIPDNNIPAPNHEHTEGPRVFEDDD